MDRRHGPRRDYEAEQRERAVRGAEDEPLADAAPHAALGSRLLKVQRQPVAVGKQVREQRAEQPAGFFGGVCLPDALTHRRNEAAHAGRIERVLVVRERGKNRIVCVEVAHDADVTLAAAPGPVGCELARGDARRLWCPQ